MFTEYEIIALERGYKIEKDGTCLNPKGDKIGSYEKEYTTICIRIKGKKTNIKIHRIQAYQKFGDKIYEEGIQIRHLDGNSKNNCWDNLAIGTGSENIFDIPAEIRIKKSSNANKKYSDELIQEIKNYKNQGHTYKEIMKRYNISSKGTLSYIINKR